MDTKILRQKILDLAIRGKLVKQDANEEPANVLLARIQEERENQIKQGLRTKDNILRTYVKVENSMGALYTQYRDPNKARFKSTTSLEPIEIPLFRLPNNWEWSTIGNISTSVLYGVSESAKTNGKYHLLRITDIQNNRVNWDTVPYTNYDEKKAGNYLLEHGDILFARTGATVGKSYLVNNVVGPSIYASYLIRVRTSKYVLPSYIKLFFDSEFYWTQISKNSLGIGQPNVNGTILSKLAIPLPPLSEQQRIVAEVEKWMSLIDTIENGKENLLQSIATAKSKILNLAVKGKLLEKEGDWEEKTLGEIFQHNTGKALNKSARQEGQLLPYITTSNLYWDHFELDNVKSMYFKDSEIEKCTVTKGDLLVCEGGDIGRSAIWNLDYDICIQNHIHRLRPIIDALPKFYYYVLMFYKSTNNIQGKGIGMLGLSSKQLHKIILPLPPLSEQQRIVTKIEQIFAQLDSIAAAIKS